MNWKLALNALLVSSGPSLFASAREECPPKPIPIRDINFADIGGEGIHGYELRGNARIVEPAPDGIPRALRIDQKYSYALLKDIDISPGTLPEVTLSISAYIESIRPCPGCNVPDQVNSYGWVISHDNGGWDRAIFLHDERFKGMGMTSGQKPNSKFALTPTLQTWIHIIGVWRQGGECALYVENQRIPFTDTVIGNNNAGLPDVAIGAPQLRQYGKGNDNDFWIKDVKIFDYALSDEEVASLDCHFVDTLDPTIDCGQGGDLVYSCTDCPSGDGSASGCAGDCNWRPEIPNCVPKVDPADPSVDCGDHDAADCGDCDVILNGPSGCSGECKFADGQCRPPDWEPPVDCGSHEAPSCGECPLGEGASGCSGDCIWDPSLGECTDNEGDDGVSCGDHNAADCSQCDVSPDGSSGCSEACKFAEGECRPIDWEPAPTCPANCGKKLVLKKYGYYPEAGSWRVEKHVRLLGDVNGDGMDDVVAFGERHVTVALANCNGFDEPKVWNNNYSYNSGGWRVEKHPRFLADMNGDGMLDIVGFGGKGVWAALSTGSSFEGQKEVRVKAFGYNSGWRVEKHPRYVVDINGDGMADVVGFGGKGVFVSLSTGTSYTPSKLVLKSLGYEAGGWRVEKHPRVLADVNGDGLPDIVAFGSKGPQVAINTGNGSFANPKVWVSAFGYNAGTWRVDKHSRYVVDVNGDGMADVVGFGGEGVYLALSTGTSFTPSKLMVKKFGYNAGAGSWRVEKHPRFLADVNGDGKADIVAFGGNGVQIALSTGSGFGPEKPFWPGQFGYGGGGWRVEKHPRFVADVTGDGKADMVGFGYHGTHVGNACL